MAKATLNGLVAELSHRVVARAALALCIVATLIIAPARSALAKIAHVDLLRVNQSIDVDHLGDGAVTMDIKFSTSTYSWLKRDNPNIAVLLRKLRLEPDWCELADIEGHFDDTNRTFSVTYKVRGMARITREGHWELVLPEEIGLELLAIHDREAIFTSVIDSDFLDTATLVLRVNMPEGCDGASLVTSPTRLAYRMPVADETVGETLSAQFAVDARPYVMSCLAKTYGNPKFTDLWVARTLFTNTGDSMVSDYRVRYQIAGYGSWSSWSKAAQVIPGQVVVDAFFPEFDLEKVATLTGRRTATIEIEYAYSLADGVEVHETASRRVELLGRNEVVFSQLTNDESASWYEDFNNGPYILASMVTHEDPVIQQVAGWVSAQAGGAAAALKDADAKAFMKALYEFMSANGIAYQTPPDAGANGQLGQHVKYGRDVLQNRAGTCIDLAIFYASVCQAVGLEPRLFLVPGHCFPSVFLPESRRLVTVETTMVGNYSYEDAEKRGYEELCDCGTRVAYIAVDTMDLRKQGVYCLDLPVLPTSALTDWGIHAVEVAAQTTEEQPSQNGSPQQNGGGQTSAAMAQLAGRWVFNGTTGGDTVEYTMTLTANGQYHVRVKGVEPTGKAYDVEQQGTYTLGPGVMIFRRDNEHSIARPFNIRDGKLNMTFEEVGDVLAFVRVEQAA